MKPRALLVTPRHPWPLDDGGRISLWQSVWSLAQRYTLTLVTMTLPGDVAPAPTELEQLGVQSVQVPHRPPGMPTAFVRGLLGPWPLMLARYHSAAFERAIAEQVALARPEIVVVHGLHPMTHHAAIAGVPCVLRVHDVEHVRLRRFAESLRAPWTRAFAMDQVARVRTAEAALIGRADLVLAVQRFEAETLRTLGTAKRVEVVPLAVDFARFRPRVQCLPPVVLLVGTYDWTPNADGAVRFLRDGWARVRASVPDARVRVIGRNMPPALVEAATVAGGEPVGYVDSIVPEYAEASALVVPLWAGAGSRVKIVEALGAGLPVVSTTIGAEGLDLEPGRQILLGDSPAELADQVIHVLREPSWAARLAAAGRETARARFSIERVAERTVELCEEVRLAAGQG